MERKGNAALFMLVGLGLLFMMLLGSALPGFDIPVVSGLSGNALLWGVAVALIAVAMTGSMVLGAIFFMLSLLIMFVGGIL